MIRNRESDFMSKIEDRLGIIHVGYSNRGQKEVTAQ